MNRRLIRALARCAAAMAMAYPRLAAQSPDSTALPRIVVTATRVAAPIAADVLAAAVLDRPTLVRSGVRDVAEALRLLPGVAVVRSGGGGAQASLFVRGGESDYVRVLVDGVPVNDPGGAIDIGWLTLDDVDRIEMVRGPASVLYGTDAVTGVVQIFTRDGRAGSSMAAGAEAGSHGASRLDIALGGARGPASGSLSGARQGHDGWLAFNNDFRQDVFAARGRVGSPQVGTAAVSLRTSDEEFHYPTDGAGRVEDRNAYRRDHRTLVSAAVSRAFGVRVDASLTYASFQGKGRTDDVPDGPADTLGFHAYRSAAGLRRHVTDGHLDVRLTTNTLVTFGGERMRETQRSSDSSNFDLARNVFSARRDNRAIYAQVLADRGPASLSAGWRYDDNDVFGAFRTARVGAAWRAWRGGALRFAAGSGFKAPTFYETFNTAFAVGNRQLVPERSRSWEAGLRHTALAGRLTVAATWFDQRFRDLIQYTYKAPDLPNYFNVAAASARGLELEVGATASPRLRTTLTTTLLRTRVDDPGFDTGDAATFVKGRPLLRRPRHTTAIHVATVPAAATSIDVLARHVGPRDDRDFSVSPALPATLPAYTRVDVTATRRLLSVGDDAEMRLLARAENVFGVAFQEIVNFPGLGRVVTVGVRFDGR
jgi:vitamin B12 transporter